MQNQNTVRSLIFTGKTVNSKINEDIWWILSAPYIWKTKEITEMQQFFQKLFPN